MSRSRHEPDRAHEGNRPRHESGDAGLPMTHLGPRSTIAVAASAVMLALAGPARGETSAAGQFQLTFSSQAPHSATGLSYEEIFRNPSDPNAKPSPVRKTILQLPAGSQLDGRAIAACQSSDAELMLLGPSACPEASRIGQGTAESVSGAGAPFDPFPVDATLFNGGTQTVEVLAQHGTGQTLMVGHQ